MGYSRLADLVLLLHFGFLFFVVLGAFLLLRWPRLVWLHLPLTLWAVVVEYGGIICPLTPLENLFRRRAGQGGYAGGFIEHYVTAVLYPAGLTRGAQLFLGTLLLLGNAALYALLFARRGRARRHAGPPRR